MVCLDPRIPVFPHRQFYVALSGISAGNEVNVLLFSQEKNVEIHDNNHDGMYYLTLRGEMKNTEVTKLIPQSHTSQVTANL